MRYWTLEEARGYIPRLRHLLEVVHQAMAVRAAARTNGGGRSPGEDYRGALAELEAGDIILRDPASGLVDFHALGEDGVEYLLCYRLDEETIEWWHLPSEGFVGRKRLPREPS